LKVVILAGGFGSRISEETDFIPKPMINIGNRPILWHIMKLYSTYGINDFIICCGYKGNLIKEYFSNYFLYMSDVTFDMKKNQMYVHNERAEPWTVTLVDTGENTMTGGRIKRIKEYVKDEEFFCLTYGDGVGDINISELIAFHKKHQTLATLTAVSQPGRFGALKISRDRVQTFKEKPKGVGAKINGGFFVLSPKVIDLIEDDSTFWEHKPMEILAQTSEITAFQHDGFWHPMDTLRDKKYLEDLWSSGKAPWRVWK
jgi:glucose-1-phosphate cytidylyltransferase